MRKYFYIILIILFISESAFATDYVNLTDYDVRRFIALVNEIAPELKKSNGDYNIEYFEKKYASEPSFQNGKSGPLLTGLMCAVFMLNYPNPADFQTLEDLGIDVYSYLLKEGGVDYRDAEVLARHKKEFINAAAICL